MMTDERIQYFLKNEAITDKGYEELVKHYFQADKTDWYNEQGDKEIWTKVKEKQFWKLIPEELQFSGYWLIAANIETLLGSTFLVFFILALRKRFKQ